MIVFRHHQSSGLVFGFNVMFRPPLGTLPGFNYNLLISDVLHRAGMAYMASMGNQLDKTHRRSGNIPSERALSQFSSRHSRTSTTQPGENRIVFLSYPNLRNVVWPYTSCVVFNLIPNLNFPLTFLTLTSSGVAVFFAPLGKIKLPSSIFLKRVILRWKKHNLQLKKHELTGF